MTIMISRTSLVAAALGAGILALGACAPEAPNAYSPGYSRVTMSDSAAGGSGKVHKGYDRQSAGGRAALLPDACVTPDTAPDPMYLPSGCANAVNLQQMAERQSDLERGQDPGPSMAAPSVRAARAYIDGTADAQRNARLRDEASSGTRVSVGGSVSAEGGR